MFSSISRAINSSLIPLWHSFGASRRPLSHATIIAKEQLLKNAEAFFKQQKYRDAAQILAHQIRLEPHKKDLDLWFWFTRAVCEQQKMGKTANTADHFLFGNLNNRIELLDAIQPMPEAPDIGVLEYSDIEFCRKSTAQRRRELEIAKKSHREDAWDKHPERRYYKGISSLAQGHWTEATHRFNKCKEQVPEAQVKIGHGHLLLGDPDSALEAYQQVTEDNPLYHEALAGKSCAYMELGQFRKACEHIDLAHQLENRTSHIPTITANHLLGWMLYRLPQTCFTAETQSTTPYLTFSSQKLFLDIIHKHQRDASIGDRQSADLELCYAQELLDVANTLENRELRTLFIAEILSKIVAFSRFEKKPTLKLRLGDSPIAIDYTIETHELAEKVPVTTLTPGAATSAPPILLFRGTSLSRNTPGAWASFWNNFHPSGVAAEFFKKSKTEIERLLKNHPQVFGYSQGGALTALTTAHFHDKVSQNPAYPSVALNPPATDLSTKQHWDQLIRKPPLKQYPIRSDLVSRLGYGWIGDVSQIEFNQLETGVHPHFLLSFAQPAWRCYNVDAEKDTKVLTRQALSILPASTAGQRIFSLFTDSLIGEIATTVNQYSSGTLDSYVKPFTLFVRVGGRVVKWSWNIVGQMLFSNSNHNS